MAVSHLLISDFEATAPALVAGTTMFPGDQNKEVYTLHANLQQRMAMIPVGRFCRTEEVAATTLLFLENGYITGKIFLSMISHSAKLTLKWMAGYSRTSLHFSLKN